MGNIYSFIPLIAFIINGFVIAVVYGQNRKSELNKAYLIYAINLSCWVFTEFLVRQPIPEELTFIVFKIAQIFWLSIAFWFLNFTYTFINRSKDWIYFFTLTLTLGAILIGLFTDLVISGVNFRFWGPDETIGSLFVPLIFLLITVPASYSLYIIGKTTIETKRENLRKSVPLIIIGSLLALSIGLLSNVIVPHLLGFRDSFQFAESITVVQSLFIYWAIVKYRLFNPGIEEISPLLFSNMKDAVIILSVDGNILQANRAAEDLFNLNRKELIKLNVNSICPDFNIMAEYQNAQKEIELHNERKFLSLTKTQISQADVNFGFILMIQNVSSRRIAEINLKKSEEMFANLFELAPDALIVTNKNGEIQRINRKAEEIFHYKREIVVGDPIGMLIPEKYREKHEHHVQDYVSSPHQREMGVGLELFGLRSNGEEFPVDVMLSPLPSRNNETQILATVRDITDRKLTEKQIKEREQHYRSMLETLPHGVQEIDTEGTIVFTNSAFDNLHGYTQGELIGTKIWELRATERGKKMVKEFLQKLKVEKPNPGTEYVKQKTKSGTIITVQVDWNYKYDADNNLTGFISIITDISQKIKDEEIIRKSKLMLSQAEQLAHLGSWEWDVRANKVFWSDELYRIYGIRPHEFNGTITGYMEFVHPVDRKRVKDTIENSYKTLKPFSHYEQIIRPDGQVRTLLTRAVVNKDNKGRIKTMYGSCLDVTDFKKVEDELRRSEIGLRALSASLQNSKEEERAYIAREIHDELGQVLTAVKMDITLLMEDLHEEPEMNSDAIIGNLKSIDQIVDKLIQTVKNISSEIRPDILDHYGLIQAIEWQLKEFEKRSKITCSFNTNVRAIDLDKEKTMAIFRILQEALTNVGRHSGSKRVRVKVTANEKEFTLTVQDFGKGITTAERENVESVGIIGMKERVYLLGGKINIEGKENEGTTVTLMVPLSNERDK